MSVSVNKIIYKGNTLIDLTSDTATADKILSGYTAHSASGAAIEGSIPTRTNGNISINGATFTIPEGYYSSSTTKTIPAGTATTPTTTINYTPTIGLVPSTGQLIITHSAQQSITPTISMGYVMAGTAGTVSINGANTRQLTVYDGAYITLISFTIDNIPYYAETGMTWTEWVNSEYNTDGFYIESNIIKKSSSQGVGSATPSETIIDGCNYILQTIVVPHPD